MFTVFIDDSGTDPRQPSAIAAALIIPAAQLEEFDREWAEFKREEFISEFHTAECVAAQRGTDFEGWGSQRKSRICWKVREITKKYAVNAFSVAVFRKDYDDLVTGELRDFVGKYHYTWAVWSVLRNLAAWAQYHRIETPFEFVFDWMGPNKKNEARREIETVMALQESMKPGFYEGHYSFRRRADHPGLQCSDFLAWTCYQYARSVYYQSPMQLIAWDAFWDMDGHQKQTWLYALTQTREQLSAWVASEANDEVRKERRRVGLQVHKKRMKKR
jgi:hypothetical protein